MTVTPSPVPHSGADDAIMSRFPAELRPVLTSTANLAPRLAQLAVSFPVLLVALATRYGDLEQRKFAMRVVLEGRPLADAAEAMRLPYRYRHLPPEAATAPLPLARWGADATRLLAPHLPREPGQAARWLWVVQHAHQLAGETFAVWIARQAPLMTARHMSPGWLLPLAMHAWYSAEPGHLASPSPDVAWSPRAGLDRAIGNARHWLRYVTLIVMLGREGLSEPWFRGGRLGEYEITPLTRPDQIVEEAAVMRNCIASYGEELSSNACRLFRLSHRGQSVATFELRPIGPDREARITQLKGPGNMECGAEIWGIAQHWLDSQPYAECPTQPWRLRAARRRRLAAALAPYASAVPCANLPPDTYASLARLQAALMSLAREAGVGGGFERPLRRLVGLV